MNSGPARIDPIDYQTTLQDFTTFLAYAAGMLDKKEMDTLTKARWYLDLFSSKNWSIDDGE